MVLRFGLAEISFVIISKETCFVKTFFGFFYFIFMRADKGSALMVSDGDRMVLILYIG